ncbi:efflux RND transporter periplasmic adaptor subunit [Ectothiorhodospiraceae bacterium BW-2]|nr:efflux RND transporter periplasmic adaptor subunit [Ectothiorhodospiraceae bacterium BW-2]
MQRWSIVWLFPPILIGIAVVNFVASERPAPTRIEQSETARTVRTLTLEPINLIPEVRGYGSVTPARVWQAVAQVSGQVIEMHPRLRNGEMIAAGELLLRLDPTDYELRLVQAEAELNELTIRQQNTTALLQIEQSSLALAEREWQRLSELRTQNSVSQSSADSAERTLLNSRTAVQNLQNTLALIPTQRKILQTKVKQAQRDLEHTRLRAPFNLRVANLQIEENQFVTQNKQLFSGDYVDRVEVIAQLPLSSFRNLLLDERYRHPTQDASLLYDNSRLQQFTGFNATLSLDIGTHQAQWQAQFVRFSDAIDSQTRTIGVVVAVDKPLEKSSPGVRPPLSKGMFVEVTLRGKEQQDRIVVPRSALHQQQLYRLNHDNRLQIVPVTPLFYQNGWAIMNGEVKAGDQIVLTDLVPAIESMRLEPVVDREATAALHALASSTHSGE